MTKTSNRFNWTGYAIRLAAYEHAVKFDKYRPLYASVNAMVQFYIDPIYCADGARRTEP